MPVFLLQNVANYSGNGAGLIALTELGKTMLFRILGRYGQRNNIELLAADAAVFGFCSRLSENLSPSPL